MDYQSALDSVKNFYTVSCRKQNGKVEKLIVQIKEEHRLMYGLDEAVAEAVLCRIFPGLGLLDQERRAIRKDILFRIEYTIYYPSIRA